MYTSIQKHWKWKYKKRILQRYAESKYEGSENTEGKRDFRNFLTESLKNLEEEKKYAMESDSVILDLNGEIERINGVDTVDNKIEVTGDFYRKKPGTSYEPKYFIL